MGFFCEHPEEGPIQKEDGFWYCPFGGVGWADSSFVPCHHDPKSCTTNLAINDNHAISGTDVVSFGAHPLTTASVPPVGASVLEPSVRKR